MMRAIGRALRSRRAGERWRVAEDPRFSSVPRTLALGSPAFADGGSLPDGPASPPLSWSGVPERTAMLAIVVEDVDVPLPRPVAHAIAYAIDPQTRGLEGGGLAPEHLSFGAGAFGTRRYVAPSPLPGHGPHRYVFTVLAIDYIPRFDQPPTRGRLLDAIAGHVLALGEITGTREA
jgi:Raf kinase inhibitor-like YbhB/YbcL family protein